MVSGTAGEQFSRLVVVCELLFKVFECIFWLEVV